MLGSHWTPPPSSIAAHTEISHAWHRIEKNEDGTFTVHLDHNGKASIIKAGVVMFGTGRKPNSRGIGLEVSPPPPPPPTHYTCRRFISRPV